MSETLPDWLIDALCRLTGRPKDAWNGTNCKEIYFFQLYLTFLKHGDQHVTVLKP